MARPEVRAFLVFYMENGAELAAEVGYIGLSDQAYQENIALVSVTPVVTQVETTTSTVPSCKAEQEPGNLESISTSLGYAISPTFLPEGFELSSSSLDTQHRASLVYRDGQGTMLIAYPVVFDRQQNPTMVELGLLRPADAISDVSVSGRDGHVTRGGWSDQTSLAGPGIIPTDALWDYQRPVNPFFDCGDDHSGVVGVEFL